MKIAVIGNCQSEPLSSFLARLWPDARLAPLPPVHTIRGAAFDTAADQVAGADIVVSQPLGALFGALATATLRPRHPGKTWILFPSIHFGGPFPNLMYLRRPEGGTLRGPLGDYHDRRIVEAFLAGLSQAACVARLGTPARSRDAVLRDLERSFAEGAARERRMAVDVPVTGYIEAHWRRARLFYTFNHPANEVLLDIARRIVEAAGARPDPAALDRLRSERERLDMIEIPPDADVAPLLDYRVGQSYRLGRQVFPAAEMVGAFYAFYAGVPDLERIHAHAAARGAPPA